MHGLTLEDARIESASLARAEHNSNKLVETEPNSAPDFVVGGVSLRGPHSRL